jgi:hypothetical protein
MALERYPSQYPQKQQWMLANQIQGLGGQSNADMAYAQMLQNFANMDVQRQQYYDSFNQANRENALTRAIQGLRYFVGDQAQKRAAREASHSDFFGSGGGKSIGGLLGTGVGAALGIGDPTNMLIGGLLGGSIGGSAGGLADASMGGTAMSAMTMPQSMYMAYDIMQDRNKQPTVRELEAAGGSAFSAPSVVPPATYTGMDDFSFRLRP